VVYFYFTIDSKCQKSSAFFLFSFLDKFFSFLKKRKKREKEKRKKGLLFMIDTSLVSIKGIPLGSIALDLT